MRFFIAALLFLSFMSASHANAQTVRKAYFAGGCFWCMQPPYDKTEGVIETVVGYTGGQTENPTYEDVSSGTSGHFEAVEVTYDADKVSYAELLDIFWLNIDPLNPNGQFCDVGAQYRTAVFVMNDAEKQAAQESKNTLEDQMKRSFATQILPLEKFWVAEDYHQKYYLKNPLRYKVYKTACERDKRLDEVWQK